MARPTPKECVAGHLEKLGYVLDGPITFTHGGRHKVLNDILECWRAIVVDPVSPANRLEITSADTLTACQRGIELVPNSEVTCLYGDLIAKPKLCKHTN